MIHVIVGGVIVAIIIVASKTCLLYTSDAADE